VKIKHVGRSATAAAGNGEILIGRTGNVPLLGTLTGTTNQIEISQGPGTLGVSIPNPFIVPGNESVTGGFNTLGHATFGGAHSGPGTARSVVRVFGNLSGTGFMSGVEVGPSFPAGSAAGGAAAIYASWATGNTGFRLSNGYGVIIGKPLTSTLDSVGNVYGLYVSDLVDPVDVRADTTYAIHTGSGRVRLGDSVWLDDLAGVGDRMVVAGSDGLLGTQAIPSGGGGTPANPTATIGLSAVNGAASTYLRSDGAPALSQAIRPTWTDLHTFSDTVLSTSILKYASA